MLHSSEQYCLAWESKYLMELGNALDSLLNGFVNMMAQEALKFTVLSGKKLNPIRSAWVALVHFQCGAFLKKECFGGGSAGIAPQKWPENFLYHTCNLAVLSWTAEPPHHCVILFKLQLETPSFTCAFPYIITHLLLYRNTPHTQVTRTHPHARISDSFLSLVHQSIAQHTYWERAGNYIRFLVWPLTSVNSVDFDVS